MQMAKVRGERNFMKILVCSLSSLKRSAVHDAVTRPGWELAAPDIQSPEGQPRADVIALTHLEVFTC